MGLLSLSVRWCFGSAWCFVLLGRISDNNTPIAKIIFSALPDDTISLDYRSSCLILFRSLAGYQSLSSVQLSLGGELAPRNMVGELASKREFRKWSFVSYTFRESFCARCAIFNHRIMYICDHSNLMSSLCCVNLHHDISHWRGSHSKRFRDKGEKMTCASLETRPAGGH